jgi:hypothetical protein
VEFEIETSGLDFFYQPELTAEEIAQGSFRPENVVGSYAVYHQTKGGINDINGKEYKVGKAFHIYRPHIIDATGAETWGNLHIENGIYSVEIPQDFLDKAVYPIKSNDTFGYTTLAGTYLSFEDKIFGSNYTTGGEGEVTKITIGIQIYNAGTHNVKSAIYNDRATDTPLTNGATDARAFSGAQDKTWYDFTFTTNPTIADATEYQLFGWSDTRTRNDMFYDVKAGAYIIIDPQTYGAWPNPVAPTTELNGYKVSIYATYTPTAAATYCGHTGGDWYVNTTCVISSSTTTPGTVYIGAGGNLQCIDGAVITAKKRTIGNGGKFSIQHDGCKWTLPPF